MKNSPRPSRFLVFKRIGLLILALVLIECGLRLRQNLRSIIGGEPPILLSKDIVRILVAGDSISLVSGQNPNYVQHLEAFLNKNLLQKKFEVFNESIPAQTSDQIAQRIETLLTQYQPQIVIFMTGKSDYRGVKSIPSDFNSITSWFWDLQILKPRGLVLNQFRNWYYSFAKGPNTLMPLPDQQSLEDYVFPGSLFLPPPVLLSSELQLFNKAQEQEILGEIDELNALSIYKSLYEDKNQKSLFQIQPLRAFLLSKIISLDRSASRESFSELDRLVNISMSDKFKAIEGKGKLILAQGQAHRSARRNREATEILKKALHMDPTLWRAYDELGWINFEESDWHNCKSNFESSLKLQQGRFLRVVVSALEFCYRKSNALKQGIEFFNALLELTEEKAFVLSALARLESESGNLESARLHLEKVEKIEAKSNPRALYKGQLFFHLQSRNKTQLTKSFKAQSLQQSESYSDNTAKNLSFLNEKVRSFGATAVFMQYPNDRIETLEMVFWGSSTPPWIFDSRRMILDAMLRSGLSPEAFFYDDFEHLKNDGAVAVAVGLKEMITSQLLRKH